MQTALLAPRDCGRSALWLILLWPDHIRGTQIKTAWMFIAIHWVDGEGGSVMRNDETGKKDCSRRDFLHTVGAGVPTLKLMLDGVAGAAPAVRPEPPFDPNKFTPLDISRHLTATARDFGAREQARGLLGCEQDGLVRTPAGEQKLRGIPFLLALEGSETKRWIALSTRPSSWAVSSVEIPLSKRAAFVCVGAFCDWDRDEVPASGQEQVERIGQQLGEALLVYEDGGEEAFPIRRRFEINSPSVEWGHQCYAALPHVREAPRKLHEALPDATMWGHVQLGVGDELPPDQSPPAFIWVWPLSNPEPERNLKALRLKATSEEPLMVCGLTLYHGKENPLRLAPLHAYRIALPEPTAGEPGRWSLGVDLGVVARSYTLNDFDAQNWLVAPGKGLGERTEPAKSRYLYADIAANAAATLTLTDTKSEKHFQF